MSILASVCADGSALPPGVIFAGATNSIQSSWVADIKQEVHSVLVTATPTGWTNNQVGLAWLEQVFDRYTREKARRSWRLLIVDGHGSHITWSFLKYCDRNRILVLVFPPHSTHTLQPLDVALFSPLATSYTKQLTQLLYSSQGVAGVQKRDFFRLFYESWLSTFTPSLILRSFEVTGLSPLNAARTSTFPGQRKVDFHRFFVQTRLKCLRKSVSRRPLSAAGVVAGAPSCFVFQLFAELKSFQNGPCATQFYTFGRRPQPPLRQGDNLATPCSCKIWASARPKHKGSPREELRHDSTEHRLSTCKQGSQHGLTFHDF